MNRIAKVSRLFSRCSKEFSGSKSPSLRSFAEALTRRCRVDLSRGERWNGLHFREGCARGKRLLSTWDSRWVTEFAEALTRRCRVDLSRGERNKSRQFARYSERQGTVTPLFCVATIILLLGSATPADADPPYSATEAQKLFRLADHLGIDLVAAEPTVQDPVAIAWDAAGRLFVAEMGDYPTLATGGRIRLLEDTDANGPSDSSSLFAEKLPYPTSVLPWKQGILVTAAPDILYLEDNNGDGKADVKEVVLSGFGEGNQQLRVNGLTYGLDNWIYGANGRSNGAITFAKNGATRPPLPLANHDFRFKPDGSALELTAGFSQFGMAFDDWGNHFISWNTIPIRQVVLDQRYLERNPLLLQAPAVEDISDPVDGGRIYAITAPQARFNREPTGYFNASCGITVDRGGLFPGDVRGSAFICEPLGNVVHRKLLVPQGVTFIGKRSPSEQSSEFLASSDPWFRPVNLTSGPDGALYVVDFYREWVEHPQFVPDDLEIGIDFARGAGHGRIWRVRPKDSTLAAVPNLAGMTTKQLVEQLASPVGWHRTTAQRLLVARKDLAIVPLLQSLAESSPRPLARLHALWTLSGLESLEDPTILHAMGDEEPGIRETALKLAEPRLDKSSELLNGAKGLANDASERVRFQLACSLGAVKSSTVIETLAEIAAKDAGDPWMRTALLTSIGSSPVEFIRGLAALTKKNEATSELVEQVSVMIGVANDQAQLEQLAAGILPTKDNASLTSSQLATLAGVAEGLEHRRVAPKDRIGTLLGSNASRLQGWLANCRCIAANPDGSTADRLRAVRLLAIDPHASTTVLEQVIALDKENAVRQAAVKSLSLCPDDSVADALLSQWRNAPGTVRREIVQAILRQPQRIAALLTAIEAGTVRAMELDLDARQQLLKGTRPEDKPRAEKLLASQINANRAAIIEAYRDKLAKEGDATRGEAQFTKNCAGCHRIRGKGPLVGPELSGLVTKTPEQLIVDVLDPNREVLPNFIGFVAVTKDGDVHSGLLAAETPSAITLRKQEGSDQTLLREEIEEFRATGKSLMPEGFEQNLSPADLADLIAYLRQIRT